MGLKIGVVSKLSGFSPSGIRYFEERGIVAPSHGRNGTYRSFDLPDVARLLECRNYRECGCDTAEIAALLDPSSETGGIEGVATALTTCSERLWAQIEDAQRLEAFLSRRSLLVKKIADGNSAPEIARSPAAYWAPLWIPGEEEDVEPRIPGEEEGYPIPFADSSLLFPHGLRAKDAPGAYSVGYAVPRQFVRTPPTLASSVYLEPRRCVHALVRVGHDFAPVAEDLAAVLSYMEGNRLVPNGPAFTHRVCTLYGAREVRFDELWAPVAG